MSAFLIISFLLLAATSYFIYRWQRSSLNENRERDLPPPRFTGLFSEASDNTATLSRQNEIDKKAEARRALLERAAEGDKEALDDAHASHDPNLYDQVLNKLVEHTGSEKKLFALVSYIARSDKLPVNKELALAFIELWKTAANRYSIAEMLHTAALAHDAAVYQRAVETALTFWRNQQLPQISAEDLRVLIDSEYWILSPRARSSGAGFILKQRLARLRRELATARPDESA